MGDRIRLPGLGCSALALIGLLAHAPAVRANEAVPEGAVAAPPSIFQHMLVSNGFLFGPLMLFLALSLLVLILSLAWGLRRVPVEDDSDPKRWEPQERALRWLGGLGVLSPMLGLLGTLFGMMLMFMSLAGGGRVSAETLAIGMSHALPVLVEGIFLACVAIPAYILFKNRLQRLTLATRG
jgi:hypothetical protein